MFDLAAEIRLDRKAIDAAIRRVIDSAKFVQGIEVERLEAEFATYVGASHAIGVGSGTAALHLALLACGIGVGDEVITAPNTDSPTASVISQVGATIVFADIDPDTFNIDPAAIERTITPRTKAIIPVHLFGNPAPMTEILALAERHRLLVIEDATLAVGATVDGRRVGSAGTAGCFSFAPSKILGGFGDGGMVTTNDARIAEELRILRNYGHSLAMNRDFWGLLGVDNWEIVREGYNERLDEIQAAILRVKLARLEDRLEARRRAAARLDEALAGLPIRLPSEAPNGRHVFRAYTILLDDRDRAREFLAGRGISTRLYYTPPLHLQPAFRHLGHRSGAFPAAELTAGRMLSLPIYPSMSSGEVDRVATALADWQRVQET
ncbi:MAG: DegT/DnrJ/EryC1/StrS family aminotransferase [Candidatus Limnocylindrales bacterium]